MINDNKIIVQFFVYGTYHGKYDSTVTGLNGTFGEDEGKLIAEFISNPKEHDLTPIHKAIEAKYPNLEYDSFHTVHATLEYISGEYGEYGVCYAQPYYDIRQVLEVFEVVPVLEPESIETTESA